MAAVLFLVFVSILSLMAVRGQSASMSQLFTVDPSCNQYNMDQYLNDALTMLGSARSGISTLQSTRSFIGGTKTRHYMRNAANMFGTTYYSASTFSGLNEDDKDTLTTVDGNLQTLQDLLAGQTVATGGAALNQNGAYLSCDDSPYEATDQASNIDPRLTAAESVQDIFGVPFLYYIPGNEFTDAQGAQRRVLRPNYGSNTNTPICGTGVVAVTQVQNAITQNEPLIQIILCPYFFSSFFQQTIVASPASTDLIVNYQFAASVLIHELMHTLGDSFPDTSFTLNGDTSNTLYRPYGPTAIYALANDREDFQGQYSSAPSSGPYTTELPDAYRIFCDMCQFPNTKWFVWGASTGPNKVKRTFRPKRIEA